MFYLFEIFNRIKYLCLSFLFVFILFYSFKDNLLVIFLYSILVNKEGCLDIFEINNFIYTHPAEIFSMYLLLILYFSFIFILPFFFLQFLDFFKQSLYKKEYLKLKKIMFFFHLFIYFFNFLGLFYIFPYFWFILDSFNKSTFFFLLFELKVNDYILFLLSFLTSLNFLFIAFFLFFYLLQFINLKTLIYWKRLFVFFYIVFATLLSPPDVYSQVILLSFFFLSFELLLFIYMISIKNKLYIVAVKN